MKRKMVINLFGGPGSGKSTTAAGVFALLKIHGVNCELVTEFAKDLTWEERIKTLGNQTYIFAKQHHKLWRIPDSVEVIITDSPLIQTLLYIEPEDTILKYFTADMFNTFKNMCYYLTRVKPYNPVGRSQTENEAKELDIKIQEILIEYVSTYETIDGDYSAINKIVSDILDTLNHGTPKMVLSEIN